MADKFFIEKKKEKSGEVHAKHNFAWVLGCIVLFLIALTFVLPATGVGALFSHQDGIVFGKFGRREIKYGENTYMYSAYQNYRDQMSMFFSGGSGNDSFLNQYSMSEAYNSAVTREGILYYADKSKEKISTEEVNDYIKKNYVDENGNFYQEAWRELPYSTKQLIRSNSKDDIKTSKFIDDLTSAHTPNAAIDFLKGFLPKAKNFDCLVFIGDNAADDSQKALDRVKKGASLEAVAKDSEKTVANVTNVFEKDFALINSQSQGGDIGKFYQALSQSPELRSALFELKNGSVYSDVISVNDTEKLVVVSKGDISAEQNDNNIKEIENALPTNYEFIARDIISKSKLHKNNFSKVYNKYFK